MRARRSVVSAAIASTLIALSASWAQASDHRMITASDLKWVDVPSLPPGAKIAVIEGPMTEAVPFTIRLKFPANYSIPAHSHPAVERVTVLSGTFHMGTGDRLDSQKGMPLGPGDMMIMQPKTNHFGGRKTRWSCSSMGQGRGVSPTSTPLTTRERSDLAR